MNRKPISWKLDLSSTAPRVYRSFLLVVFTIGFFSCDIGRCLGQVTSADAGTVLSLAAAGQNGGAVDSRSLRAQLLEYERQLNAMLKTRRDEEKEFVGLVVNQIRLGRIPSKLVSTSFEWVRNKRPTTKYPFVYFERVLRLQADRLGLASEIPPFDFSIYSEENRAVPGAVSETPSSNPATNEASGGFGGRRSNILANPLFGTTEGSTSDRSATEGRSIFRLGAILLDRLR